MKTTSKKISPKREYINELLDLGYSEAQAEYAWRREKKKEKLVRS